MKIKSPEGKDRILLYGLGVTGKAILSTFPNAGWKVTLYNDQEVSLDDLVKEGLNLSMVDLAKDLDEIPWSDLAYVVKAPVIPLDKPLLKRAGEEGLPVCSDIELAYRLFPNQPMVAITGSNGKTTTTSMVTHILNGSGHPAIACGNIGLAVFEAIDKADPDTWLVIESSSFQLASVDRFKPPYAAILNVTPDHIDWHKDFAHYAACKFNISKSQGPEDILYLNPYDRPSREAFESGRFKANVKWIDPEGEWAQGIRQPGFWTLVGSHNVDNALFAAGLCHEIGLDWPTIKEALQSFRAIEHRMEVVDTINGVTYINDSKATNVDSAVRAIHSLQAPLIVIAGGYDKHVPFDEFYEAFRPQGKAMILMGQTRETLKQGMEERGMGDRVVMVDSLKEAIDKAYDMAQAGDVVLLSPASASWGMYNNFEERGQEFKDLVQNLKGRN